MNTKTWTGILSHVCGAIKISLLPAFPNILQKNGANLRSSCPHWPLLCTAAFLLHFHQNPISPHSPEAPPPPTPSETLPLTLPFSPAYDGWPHLRSSQPVHQAPRLKHLEWPTFPSPHPYPTPHPLVPHATPLLSGHHHCSPLAPHLSNPPFLQRSSPTSTAPRTPQSILWRKNIIYSVLPR